MALSSIDDAWVTDLAAYLSRPLSISSCRRLSVTLVEVPAESSSAASCSCISQSLFPDSPVAYLGICHAQRGRPGAARCFLLPASASAMRGVVRLAVLGLLYVGACEWLLGFLCWLAPCSCIEQPMHVILAHPSPCRGGYGVSVRFLCLLPVKWYSRASYDPFHPDLPCGACWGISK